MLRTINSFYQDLSVTEFGNKVAGLDKLVRLACMEQDNRVKKVVAVVFANLSLVAIGGLLAVTAVVIDIMPFLVMRHLTPPFGINFSNLIPTAVKIVVFFSLAIPWIFIMTISTIAPFGFLGIWSDRFSLQMNEQELLRALGGKQIFNTLPQLRLDKELPKFDQSSRWDSYHEYLTPEEVYHHPMVKGVDKHNNFFVAFCIEPKEGGEAFVITLLPYKTDSSKKKIFSLSFVCKDDPDEIFARRDSKLQTDLQVINSLVNGTHPGFRLVAPLTPKKID